MTATAGTGRPRVAAIAPALDAACVVVFVAVGRRNHDAEPGIGGVLATAAPFLIGAALAWLVVPVARRAPASVRAGAGIWLVTVGVGLALRRLVFGDGIALPFVIVAALVLGGLLVGWRAATTLLSRRGQQPLRSAASP